MEDTETVAKGAEGDRIPWGWVALTAVLLEIALALSAVAWVAINYHFINPGHDNSYYHKHADFAGPLVSVVVGIPYFFFACRLVGLKAGTRAIAASLWIWFIVFIIDVLLVLVKGPNAYIGVMLVLSLVTKLLSAYLGGKAALRNAGIARS